MYYINKESLWYDLLIFRNKSLHDRPGDEIGHRADTEHDHVPSRFTLEAQEGERAASFLGIVEENTRALVDHIGTDATGHSTHSRDGSNC